MIKKRSSRLFGVMKMTNEKKVCKKCGNTEFFRGVQQYQGQVFNEKSLFSDGSTISHVFCSQCGLIAESYVNKPKKFQE